MIVVLPLGNPGGDFFSWEGWFSMYLRFVVATIDPDSRVEQGLFFAAA